MRRFSALASTRRSSLNTALVITSREAGFRHVAAHLAPVCARATISPFDAGDIGRLSVAWHKEVVGDSDKVRSDAEKLAAAITGNDRILRLATNPLLLTTLLLVRRWVGSLPTRRAILYGKAVEVLLMTWNTEGHEPIPHEEALPQLCYVASAMMLEGVQKVSRPRLADLLQHARSALPTELGFVKGTVDQFIHRVEDRSSLLMMTGHDVESGRLVEFFEFRHLTFQEFLTARAMVEGWHPGRTEGDTLANVLEPHFESDEWREIVPLAAVLGGKATEGLIQRLTARAQGLSRKETAEDDRRTSVHVLGHCLADEAAARPDTIRAAMRELVRLSSEELAADLYVSALATGRYGAEFREESRRALMAATSNAWGPTQALADAVKYQLLDETAEVSKSLAMAYSMLAATETVTRCEGALAYVELCFRLHDDKKALPQYAETLREAGTVLLKMLFGPHVPEQLVATWALVWLGACRVWMPPAQPDVLGRMFDFWQHAEDEDFRRIAGWAITSQKLARRTEGRCSTVPLAEIDRMLQEEGPPRKPAVDGAALVLAWYRRARSDGEIAERIRAILPKDFMGVTTTVQTLNELLLKIERLSKRDTTSIKKRLTHALSPTANEISPALRQRT